MNRLLSRVGARALTAAFCLVTVGRLTAQTTTAPAGTDNPDAKEETLVLSPFVVEAGEDKGYIATNTLAGTRVRTELKDVGSAIQVVTQKFLADTNSKSSQDLLVYTTNTEVGGQGGNFANLGNSAQLNPHGAAVAPQNNTRIRGLDSADNTRDYFLTNIPWDGYIVGRVDIQRGANAVLFGIGSPAGIVNSSINGASFKDQNTAEFRFSRFGSTRESLDINRVILKDELSVRLDFLNDETFYRQKPGFNHDKRYFGALRYDPKFLSRGSAHTTFKASFEKGDIDANRPDPTPPVDALSPWFNNAYNGIKQWTYDARTINTTDPLVVGPGLSKTAGGINPANTDRYNPYVSNGAGGAFFDGIAAAFYNQNSPKVNDYFWGSMRIVTPSGYLPSAFSSNGNGVNGWDVYMGIIPYNSVAGGTRLNLPANELGVYKARVITDPKIFDFYNNMIEGPNKHEKQNFDAFNTNLAQTFFNGKLGFEAAYDRQNYYQEQTGLFGDQTPWLTVDIISVLPDGRANPNVGRAMTVSRSNANSSFQTKRDTFRITGFGEYDFKDHTAKDSMLGRILGRHVITGLYSKAKTQTDGRGWIGQALAPQYPAVDGVDPSIPGAGGVGPNSFSTISYLGGSLIGKTLGGANIPAITAEQVLTSGQAPYFISEYKPGVTAANAVDLTSLVGWQMRPVTILDGNASLADRSLLSSTSGQNKRKDQISSKVAVWQGYLFDGVVVPMVAWRKDISKSWDAGEAPHIDYSGQKSWSASYSDPNSPLWKFKDEPDATVEGSTKSYSVVLHTPKRFRSKLPWGTDISLFYNKSDNFRPDASSIDLMGHHIAPPSGKTKDYGVTITTLNDKLTLKVNRYESNVSNARLTGDPGAVYAVGYAEGWAYMFARWAQLGIEGFSNNWALTINNQGESPTNPRIDPNVAVLRYQPLAGQTVAQALQFQNDAINAVIANEAPADFVNAWGIQRVSPKWDPTKGWGAAIAPTQPSGLQLTGDTVSKGTEFELIAQPTPQWTISANASKTDAQRLNLAASFASWVEGRYKLYTTTPLGNVRFWNGGNDQDSLTRFYQQFYGPYTLYRLQEGANVPELRPWHFNVVTNYSFNQGKLKNVNVGGAWRWANGVVTGYPIKNNTFDLPNPYTGPSETAVDLWVGYERKLRNKINWRIQLNIRNAFGKKDLVPISVEPDGSLAAGRIPEPTTWAITNTFKF